jgi:hypothetical protein
MKWKSKFAFFSFVFVLAAGCAGHYQFPIEAMRLPPGGLSPDEVPLFVSFGTDDNPYSGLEGSGGGGGLNYLTELFASRRNPAGNGDPRNFDGQPIHYSFYVNTIFITPEGKEDPEFVKRSWKDALAAGHEIGVHTHSHPHGQDFSVAQWEEEIQRCLDLLAGPEGLGVPRNQIIGFRTPFLEFADKTFKAVRRKGLKYDCSIEEGFQADQDGTNYVWPFPLNHGSPGYSSIPKTSNLPRIKNHSGLWELPVYPLIVPPDDLSEAYGVPPGLRAKLLQKKHYFELDQGKIAGMDWNLWFEYEMSKSEFLATLKYSLDQRLKGNRCPMTVGLHSAIYSEKNEEQPPGATVEERREALREFLDYALSKPEVRIVSSKELLAWLQQPAK